MLIRAGHSADIPTIVRWRKETAAWLARNGSDQWSEAGLADDEFLTRVTNSISAGETWIAENDGKVVGTAAIDQWADPGLWTPAELAESLIIHRMIVPRSHAGQGIGEFLLDHADRLAAAAGQRWLRLDAWTVNTQLHKYYRAQGFQHVRDVAGKVSGALFERSVADRFLIGDKTLPSKMVHPRTLEPDESPTEQPPDHWLIVDDLVVDRHHIRSGGRAPVELNPNNAQTLHFDGLQWRCISLSGWGIEYADTVVEWPRGLVLDPRLDYTVQEIGGRANIKPAAAAVER
jgi:GNAT superfamily N-acetyltransferase